MGDVALTTWGKRCLPGAPWRAAVPPFPALPVRSRPEAWPTQNGRERGAPSVGGAVSSCYLEFSVGKICPFSSVYLLSQRSIQCKERAFVDKTAGKSLETQWPGRQPEGPAERLETGLRGRTRPSCPVRSLSSGLAPPQARGLLSSWLQLSKASGWPELLLCPRAAGLLLQGPMSAAYRGGSRAQTLRREKLTSLTWTAGSSLLCRCLCESHWLWPTLGGKDVVKSAITVSPPVQAVRRGRS